MLAACAPHVPGEAPPQSARAAVDPDARPPVTATIAPAPSSAAAAPNPDAARAAPTSCGDGCLAFATAEAAFEHVLGRGPRVLAIGEAHAQKGTEHVPSATRRFADQLLPRLTGRASAVVVEVMVAAGKCGAAEQRTAEKQRPVVENQAETAQNEFVELAHRARSLGIEPQPLRPSCEEYAAIAAAGADDIELLLRTITQITTRVVTHLLARPDAKLVLTYGGALHNDAEPRPGREHWSFGPELRQRTNGAYLELDLIVPEYVKDTEVWRALPWYPAFASAPESKQVRLFETGASSYALVFASSR